jgi:hypothetical protein
VFINLNLQEGIMKNVFSGMAVALTMWLGVVTGAANAEVVSLSDWTGSATTGYTATFGRSGLVNSFIDTYNFSLPLDSSGNFTANVDGFNGRAAIVFSAFYLIEASLGKIAWGPRGAPYSSLHNNNVGNSTPSGPVPGNYTLYVGSNGPWSPWSPQTFRYDGRIVILPVPEPATYAMMLAGLGLIGFSARRKINNG